MKLLMALAFLLFLALPVQAQGPDPVAVSIFALEKSGDAKVGDLMNAARDGRVSGAEFFTLVELANGYLAAYEEARQAYITADPMLPSKITILKRAETSLREAVDKLLSSI